MNIDRPIIHLDMFKPVESGAYPKPIAELRDRFFGPSVGGLFEAIKRGREKWDIESLKGRLDTDFLRAFGEAFGFSDPSQAQEFYFKQLKQANTVISYVTGIAMPSERQKYMLLSETNTVSDRPSDAIEWLAMADRWQSPDKERLQNEITRQLLLAGVSAGIDNRSRRTRVSTILSSVKKALAAGFYEHPGTDDYSIYSTHNNESNGTEFVGFEPDTGIGAEAHVKRRKLLLRTVPDVGRVMVEDRVKDGASAIIKALAKARNNGGWVTTDDVQDMGGITFTVLEPDNNLERVDKLENGLIDYMMSHKVSTERILGRLIGFMPDNLTDEGRNKSPRYSARRLQAVIDCPNGERTLFEFVFKSAIQGWDHEYMTGDRNPDTGLFDGTAHAVYRVQRIMDILPVLYPSEIYGDSPGKSAMMRLEQVVSNLKNDDRFVRMPIVSE